MFSAAKCGHCNKTGTKVQTIEPAGSKFKQIAICCSACNAILGVAGFYDAGSIVQRMEAEQTKMQAQLNQIEQTVRAIAQSLRSR